MRAHPSSCQGSPFSDRESNSEWLVFIRVHPYHYSEKSLFLAKIYRSQSTIPHSLFTIHFGCGSAALGSPVVDDSLYCLETAKENCLVTQLVVCYLSQPMCTELSRLTPQSPLEYPR